MRHVHRSFLIVAFCAAASLVAGAAPLPYRFVEKAHFTVDLPTPNGITIDTKNRLYVASGDGVGVFYLEEGKRLRLLKTDAPATAVAVDEDGAVYAALQARIVKISPEGKTLATWGKEGKGERDFGYITSLALRGPVLFVADAGNRRLVRYAVNGDFVDAQEGYLVPSPYFDCVATRDDHLLVTDPGNHKVIVYDANMERVREWGRFGDRPEQFVGCCNPCAIAVWPDGRVATAEKGEPRLKMYSPDGKLLALLGPETFPFASGGMDLAIDKAGRLIALETGRGDLRIYELRKAEEGSQR